MFFMDKELLNRKCLVVVKTIVKQNQEKFIKLNPQLSMLIENNDKKSPQEISEKIRKNLERLQMWK